MPPGARLACDNRGTEDAHFESATCANITAVAHEFLRPKAVVTAAIRLG